MTLRYLCKFDMKKLITGNKFERPKEANYFFELYLVDWNGSLIDVPILIENAGSDSGGFPNRDNDMSQWILTRRFFMFDTLSGIPQNEFPNGTPDFVTYPSKMTFEMALDPNNEEMIFVPYLRIDYRTRTKTYIESNSARALVEFGTYYSSSTESFWSTAMAIFYIVLVIMLLILIIKTQVMLSKPTLSQDQNDKCRTGLITALVNLLDFFSTMYFWYIFFMTGYWFVFFKLQERVYCFMPTHKTYWENFEQYDWLFGWVTGAKLVFVIFKVYFDQSSFDVYLIDWERPKPQQNQVPIFEGDKVPSSTD